jgi:hypothetical protein
MFAGRIATAGDRAPVYVIALGTIRQRPAPSEVEGAALAEGPPFIAEATE